MSLAAGIEAVAAAGADRLAAVHAAAVALTGVAGVDAVVDGAVGLCPAPAVHVLALAGGAARVVPVAECATSAAVDGHLVVELPGGAGAPLTMALDPAVVGAGLLTLATAALGAWSRELLDAAVEHARRRHQFGQPIGGFQALRHQLADALVAVESMDLAVEELAALGVTHPRFPDQARLAKLSANAAALAVRRCAHQVCGGWGYLEEAGLGARTRSVHAMVTGIGASADLRRALLARPV